MGVDIAAFVARRLLKSRRGRGAAGTISAVAICGIAVATAAIVCVLSVFNGFRDSLSARLNTLAPDIIVLPAEGKVFDNAEHLAARLSALPEVAVATPTLSDNALAVSNEREMPISLKGVIPADYRRVTEIDSVLTGESRRAEIAPHRAVVAVGVANRIGAYQDGELLIFAPRRLGRVNLANPAASFVIDSLSVSGVSRTDQAEYDNNLVLVDLPTARRLFGRTAEASAIEIAVAPGANMSKTAAKISKLLGGEFIVRDREEQQQTNFRMVNIEKWVTFLLLFFILIIASFNIISAMTMLVIEKEQDSFTLRALGLSRRRVGEIFARHSLHITMIGGAIGIVLGLALALAQQHFGLITIDTGAEAPIPYPVVVNPLDILVTLIPLALTATLTAAVASAFAIKRFSV